jgi:hypothetical protein
VVDVEGAHRVRQHDPGDVVDGQRGGQPGGEVTEALQPAGHLGGLGGHGQHADHGAVRVADHRVAPGERGLLDVAGAAAGHRHLGLGLQERLAGAVDVGDDAAHAGGVPQLAEHVGGRAGQRRRVPGAEHLRVRVVVDQHVVVAVRQHHRHRRGQQQVDGRPDHRVPRVDRAQRGRFPGEPADQPGTVEGTLRRHTGLIGQRGHR